MASGSSDSDNLPIIPSAEEKSRALSSQNERGFMRLHDEKPTPHFLSQPDAHEMVPASNVLSHAIRSKPGCLTVQKLCMSSYMYEIPNMLEDMGFRRINHDFKAGGMALVFEGGNHQMIRLVTDREQARNKDSDILQPVKTIELPQDFRIEILPKVHILAEILQDPQLAEAYGLKDPEQEARGFLRHLVVENFARDNFLFDPSMYNVALIHDKAGHNVPVIIDAGAVVPLEAAERHHFFNFAQRAALTQFAPEVVDVIPDKSMVYNTHWGQHHTADEVVEMGQQLAALLHSAKVEKTYPYEEAQAEHLKRLRLEAGKLTGVVSSDDLRAFSEVRKGIEMSAAKLGARYSPRYSTFVRLVQDEGVYPTQLAEYVRQALQEYFSAETMANMKGDTERPGFCERIEQIHRNNKLGIS